MRIRKIGSDRKKKRKPEISESVGFDPEKSQLWLEEFTKTNFRGKQHPKQKQIASEVSEQLIQNNKKKSLFSFNSIRSESEHRKIRIKLIACHFEHWTQNELNNGYDKKKIGIVTNDN